MFQPPLGHPQTPVAQHIYVLKDFDAQLESYLLADFRRQERAESNMNLGMIYSDGAKVMSFGEHIKRSWLTMKGTTAETLKDWEEIVFSVFQYTWTISGISHFKSPEEG